MIIRFLRFWFRGPAPQHTKLLQATARLAQISVIIGAIEDLAAASKNEGKQRMPWRIARLSTPKSLQGKAVFEKVMTEDLDRATSYTQIACSLGLLLVPNRSRAAAAMELVQVAALVRQYFRNGGYGRDGSDHGLIVEHSMLTVSAIGRNNEYIQKAALTFLGAQGIFSYIASGTVKLISPIWRNGRPISSVLRTVSYGDERMHRFLRRHPKLEHLAAWGVIAGETTAPLAMILPEPLRRTQSVALLGLHVGIARYMGLNRFLWTFAAFHPAMEYVSGTVNARIARALRGKSKEENVDD